MLIFLALFALGSALCGAAQNLNWLIAARGESTMVVRSPSAKVFDVFLQPSKELVEEGYMPSRPLSSLIWFHSESARFSWRFWECMSVHQCPHFVTYPLEIFRTWAVACAMGPCVGGALAKSGQWRWLFCASFTLSTYPYMSPNP